MVHVRLSLLFTLKMSSLIKEFTEKDEVDVICGSEQVLTESWGGSEVGCSGYGELGHQAGHMDGSGV